MLKNKQDIDDVNQLLASFNLVKETVSAVTYTCLHLKVIFSTSMASYLR